MKKASDVDRGWAWLVLVSVYTGAIIIYTTAYLGGVMYVALLQHFDAGETKTSLVGALNHGLLNLLGNKCYRIKGLIPFRLIYNNHLLNKRFL